MSISIRVIMMEYQELKNRIETLPLSETEVRCIKLRLEDLAKEFVTENVSDIDYISSPIYGEQR
jgi:hypothetical protein